MGLENSVCKHLLRDPRLWNLRADKKSSCLLAPNLLQFGFEAPQLNINLCTDSKTSCLWSSSNLGQWELQQKSSVRRWSSCMMEARALQYTLRKLLSRNHLPSSVCKCYDSPSTFLSCLKCLSGELCGDYFLILMICV